MTGPHAHGGDGASIAARLGVSVAVIMDLSASMNPAAPDPRVPLGRHLDAVTHYPDPSPATAALAAAIGTDPDRLLLTNGGSEAIGLLADVMPGRVREPDFALYPRRHHGPLWRSNPHNPTGRLAGPDDRADVWDEAFYPLATGRWTRGDDGVPVVGSLTKLFGCAGLRVGYVLADAEIVRQCRDRQPAWAVNSLACAALPDMIAAADLPGWAATVRESRGRLCALFRDHGYRVCDTDANWVLVTGDRLRERLIPHHVVVRDCTNFGMPGVVRVAVPPADRFDQLARALDHLSRDGGRR